MRKILMMLGVFAFTIVSFMFVAAALSRTQAATVGEAVQITGTLEENIDPNYTHKVSSYNLIINARYNDWVGSQVEVVVTYTSQTAFRVNSVNLLDDSTAPAPNTGSNSDITTSETGANTFEGRLSFSPRGNRDYRISSSLGSYVDLLVNDNYDAWIGREVRLTYTGVRTNFRIVSLQLIN